MRPGEGAGRTCTGGYQDEDGTQARDDEAATEIRRQVGRDETRVMGFIISCLWSLMVDLA